MIRTNSISILLAMLVASVFSLTAQEAMIIDPNGNVGINTNTPNEKLDVHGNIQVEGTINSNGPVYAPNQVFDEVVVVTDTFPNDGGDKYISLPVGFTSDNTFIVSAKVRSDGNTWYDLGLSHPSEWGLRLTLIPGDELYLLNRWGNNSFDNRPVIVILGRIEGISY